MDCGCKNNISTHNNLKNNITTNTENNNLSNTLTISFNDNIEIKQYIESLKIPVYHKYILYNLDTILTSNELYNLEIFQYKLYPQNIYTTTNFVNFNKIIKKIFPNIKKKKILKYYSIINEQKYQKLKNSINVFYNLEPKLKNKLFNKYVIFFNNINLKNVPKKTFVINQQKLILYSKLNYYLKNGIYYMQLMNVNIIIPNYITNIYLLQQFISYINNNNLIKNNDTVKANIANISVKYTDTNGNTQIANNIVTAKKNAFLQYVKNNGINGRVTEK